MVRRDSCSSGVTLLLAGLTVIDTVDSVNAAFILTETTAVDKLRSPPLIKSVGAHVARKK